MAEMKDYPPMQDEYFPSRPPFFAMWRIKQTAESRFIVERRWWYWPVWTDTSTPYMTVDYPGWLPMRTLDEARLKLAQLKGKRKMEPRYWYEG